MGIARILGKLLAPRGRAAPSTFLGRLARDTRGNTLAMMAAALIPFCGLVGGGIDLSRMYITKTRLQHACDAGALAGRKTMGAGVWTSNNNAANAAALQFFRANFTEGGMYGGSAPQVAFSENAGKVTGTASAVLPMTLMKVLGMGSETIAVSCDAEMRLPNTDVMFVLDTTGSMNCRAADIACNNNGNVPAVGSKIDGLKVAVKCFYEIVARLDTDATCTTGTPSGGTGNQVQIRFGFMPYATNVNVGKLLPTAYFADRWQYQSREPRLATTTTGDTWSPAVASTPVLSLGAQLSSTTTTTNTFTNGPNNTCVAAPPDVSTALGVGITSPTTTSPDGNTRTYTVTSAGTTTTTTTTSTRKQYIIYYCEVKTTVVVTAATSIITYTSTRTRGTTTTRFDGWHYARVWQNIAGLKNGTNWNNEVNLPLGSDGAMIPIGWDGCIEERQTERANSYSPIPSGAKDLDIDLVPTPGDASTLWGPALQNVIYTRAGALWTTDESDSSLDYGNGSGYYCPTQARKLQAWPDATTFDSYVDSLVAVGNTYHDIGLLWGARFASPTGLFAAENALTPQGGEIERNIIFMTDGDTQSFNTDYNAYGVPWYDRRQTDPNSIPSTATLNDQINKRFSALCDAVKNKNITLWVISFGNGSNKATEDRLEQCATTGRYFAARDSATLQATFASIANQISSLRLTR